MDDETNILLSLINDLDPLSKTIVLGLIASLTWYSIDQKLNNPNAVNAHPSGVPNVIPEALDQERTKHDEYQDLMMLGLSRKLEQTSAQLQEVLGLITKLNSRLESLEKPDHE